MAHWPSGRSWRLRTVTLVAASLEGSQALDTVDGLADPTAIRTLKEGTIQMYQSIGCILIAIFSAAAGYATLSTRVFPKMERLFGLRCCHLQPDSCSFRVKQLSIAPAAVLAVAVLADFPLQIRPLNVSIVLFRKREAVAPMLAHAG